MDFAEREILAFAREHKGEDTARLLLGASRYPGIDMQAAVQQIEGLRTAREKWPSLLECEDFLYPPRLNREQSSSEATARYKATLLSSSRIADLTGGMGIDTLAFAKVADHVDYVEHDPALCAFMERNLQALSIANVTVHCTDSLVWLAGQESYDLIYIDPARRGVAGRRVTAFEDCTPDLLQHLDLLRSRCRRLLVKASPMIDITLATTQLGTVAEVHIVALHGECKELLFLCDSRHSGEPTIHCVDIKDLKDFNDFPFIRSEETAASAVYCDRVGRYLYDPHAALRKGGCFRLLGQRYGLPLLAANTHLYTSPTLISDFPGRTFEVLQEVVLDRKAIKKALPDGRAHVVTRNFPAEAAVLQRRLGLTEGGDLFVIATTVGTRRTGLLCRQM